MLFVVPPVLLFIWCIECEYGTSGGLLINLILVGLLNAALYAAIAISVFRRRERKMLRSQWCARLLPVRQTSAPVCGLD